MKKLLGYLVFIFALMLTINSKVYSLDCEYSDGKLTAKFTVTESSGNVGKATIKGTIVSTDETNINHEHAVDNWDKTYTPFMAGEIRSKGKDYYTNFKDCPPYAVFIDKLGNFDFAVTTSDHLSEFTAYAKQQQGYAIMPLTKSTAAKNGGGGGTSPKDAGTSCLSYKNDKTICEHNNVFACVWNDTPYGSYCNTDNLKYVSCGSAFDIPYQVPQIMSFIVNFLKIGTPILLIIVSMVTLMRALAAQRDDEIKKAKDSLIRKLIASIFIFFLISIVQFVILKFADDKETKDLSTCLSCLLNNDCENNLYYKTNVSGTYLCTYLNGESDFCPENK